MTVPVRKVDFYVFMMLNLIGDILDGERQFVVCKFIQEHSQFP
jgi:hypothetical protein